MFPHILKFRPLQSTLLTTIRYANPSLLPNTLQALLFTLLWQFVVPVRGKPVLFSMLSIKLEQRVLVGPRSREPVEQWHAVVRIEGERSKDCGWSSISWSL